MVDHSRWAEEWTARREESRGAPEAFSQLVFQSRYTIINLEREVSECGCLFFCVCVFQYP